MKNRSNESPITLTVLGCGVLGTAILSGIFSYNSSNGPTISSSSSSSLDFSTSDEDLLPRIPSQFIACVRRPESVERVSSSLSAHHNSLKILQDDNLQGVRAADVVVLAVPPSAAADVLSVPGMREAMEGKLLVSILAGITVDQIEGMLYGGTLMDPSDNLNRCKIVRVMPNTACAIQQSMTLIMQPSPPLPPVMNQLVIWIFSRVGEIAHVTPTLMDAGTALCGSSPAFFALMLEAIVDGAVTMGIQRPDALKMAAYAMRGTAGLVLTGEHPAVVREKVTTPGGSTIRGCLVMEEGRLRATLANALIQATVAASRQGQKD